MRAVAIIVALMLSVMAANAKPITREQARKKAESFMALEKKSGQLSAITNGRKLAPGQRRSADGTTAEYYVFNKGMGEGYVIVSGDDRTEPILGYCDEGEFDYEQLPPQLQGLLNDYARQIARLQQGRGVVISDAIPTHPKVPELMKSKWSQGYPYNLTCPEYFSLGRSVTGCVATAIAQILYYHREKSVSETTAAMPAYDTWTEHPTYGHLHVEGIPEGSPIDWENMKDEYGTATEKQRKAVADLMHYCGVAVKMDYTNASSGAQSYDAYQAFGKYFGYGSSVRYVSYSTVTSDTEWDRIVYAEIAAGRPVYVSGSNSEAGHAFVADGYDGNLKYHINWGWGGTSDGYYLLTNLTPGQQGIGGSNDGYNGYREIVVGIEPENYGEKPMTFVDAAVRKLCLEHFDSNGDGQLTYGEAAAVQDIGTVFKGSTMKSFKELYYFTSLTAIPDDAFSECRQLTALRLPKNIRAIGNRSFSDCVKLSQLELPNHVSSIGERAFWGCEALSSLALPDELPSISDGAFGATGLTSVSLPLTITSIGSEAFASCQKLKTFEVKSYQPSAIQLSLTAFAGTDLSAATLTCLQGTRSFFSTADVWKDFGRIVEKRELSEGKFTQLEAGKKYYIYNAGTGQYLTKGEAWGTQAIVGDDPMRFVVNHTTSMPEGVYYLTSEDTGKSGNLLFRTSTDSNVGNGVKAAFVDGTLSANRANAYWTITPVADDVYTIQIPSDAAGYEEGLYWGVQTDHASNIASPTYGVYADVDYAARPANCQWRFVLYDEEAVARYSAARTLGTLLEIAQGRKLKVTTEQAVYDQLESSYEELCAAQRSLRKKLKFIDFADETVRETFISSWDIDSDGELSILEASKVTDFYVSFQGNKSLKSVDELQYLTTVPDIYGNTFEGCTNLESVILPDGLVHIYYRAFRNCQKLTSINIPEMVTLIGETCFYGCKSLKSVTVGSPDPSTIALGNNVFGGVPLPSCTLYVPFGSKALYEQAPVWKDFGNIVEVRMHTQPRQSSLAVDKSGYIYNIGTRRFLAMGEAYGTQSVVATKGLKYQLKRSKSMADGLYYLHSDQTGADGKVLFRTDTDTKVGDGVKACFADGTLSSKAYWKVDSVAPGVYTLQVPAGDAAYVEGEYLGVDEYHVSGVASPTYGVYWDVKGTGTNCQWAFITVDDLAAAQAMDEVATQLRKVLAAAAEKEIDAAAEQAVYDNPQSTIDELKTAVAAVREKLHYITFADDKARTICTDLWDADGDGELSFEEAAAVTDIGESFTGVSSLKSLEELRYFTSLTEIPANAFRGDLSLNTLYLPAGITAIGEYAFRNCGSLQNLVLLSETTMIPMGFLGVPNNLLLFVPAAMVDAYSADEEWSGRCRIVEYTGKPVVTAEAQRIYGRTFATITTRVLGAPVVGTPECTCDAIKESTLPVGTYPITVSQGTVTTPGVEFREGVLTITPSSLTVTAKSYTRNVGEQNPEFELSYKGFRNRETDTVFTVRPVITCEATVDSPAGEYEIKVSGAEAANYEITYVSGTLTVVNPTGITVVERGTLNNERVYDLQGRHVTQPRRGVYIVKGKKVRK